MTQPLLPAVAAPSIADGETGEGEGTRVLAALFPFVFGFSPPLTPSASAFHLLAPRLVLANQATTPLPLGKGCILGDRYKYLAEIWYFIPQCVQ